MKLRLLSLLCIFSVLLSIGIPVYANTTFEISVADLANDTIKLSGIAPVDSDVTALILNPGVTLESIDFTDISNIDDIQYFGYFLSKNGVYSKNINIKTENGGEFTAIVFVGDKQLEQKFYFYPYGKKLELVDVIKNASDPNVLETQLPEVFEVYGFAYHNLNVTSTYEAIAKVICSQNKNYKITTSEDVMEFLNKMLVFNAFLENNNALIEDSKFGYSQYWTISGETYYDDYCTSLSTFGKNAVNSAVFAASVEKLDDVYKVFKTQVLFTLVMNNIMSGTGHIENILGKYQDDYKKEGFNLSLLENAKDKPTKFTSLLNCGATTLSTLATSFNSIFGENTSEDGNASDGPSDVGRVPSGGGGSAPVPTQTPAPTATPTPSTTPEPSAPQSACPFYDLSGAEWAGEAIDYLYKEGIVNGRSETSFAPNETVTRAELVKMICEALDVTEVADGELFADVTDSDWFAPYIRNAVAAGIVNGDGNAFKPNNAITREDAALIIFRALGLESGSEITFTDAENISEYAKAAVAAMVRDGFISGMGDGTFVPKNTLTRAQAAQLIYNAITKGGTAK